MNELINVMCWSGGKDSTACIILDHIYEHSINLILISLNYFDKKKGIYADHPQHIEFIFKAKSVFEDWGYKVEIVSSDKDYKYWFYKQRTRKGSHNERIGKYYGWLIGGMCKMNGEKTKPIKQYLKKLKNYVEYVGIGVDEKERLIRLYNRNQISLLEKYNFTTSMAYELCKSYNLLSPLYTNRKRQGCWFCPNASFNEFAEIKKKYPFLWQELEDLNKETNLVSKGFKWGKTFDCVNSHVDLFVNQCSLFENDWSDNSIEIG